MKGAFIDSVDSNSGRLFVPPDEKDGKTTFCSMTFYYYIFDSTVSDAYCPSIFKTARLGFTLEAQSSLFGSPHRMEFPTTQR